MECEPVPGSVDKRTMRLESRGLAAPMSIDGFRRHRPEPTHGGVSRPGKQDAPTASPTSRHPMHNIASLRRGPVTIALAALFAVAGCGAAATPITFDPPTATGGEPSTTFGIGPLPSDASSASTPDSSTTVPAASGQWVDITGNLAGLDSECGTVTLLTSRADRDALIAG